MTDLMIKRIIALLPVIAFILFSCNCNTPAEKKTTSADNTIIDTPYQPKPPSSFEDTLLISTPCAVFFNPDSLQLEKIRSINSKVHAQNMEHDCFYQMRNARITIKKYYPKLKIIETSKARHLLFQKTGKGSSIIDLNAKGDICGIILFNQIKDPELIDMMNVDTALGFYFNN